MSSNISARSHSLYNSLLLSIITGPLLLYTIGCSPNNQEAPPLINSAQITVHKSPLIEYRLTDFSFQQDPYINKRIMKWSGMNPDRSFWIEPSLTEGVSSVENWLLWSSGLIPESNDLPANQICTNNQNCRGESSVLINKWQRKMMFDLNLNFNINIPICDTRYCVNVAEDQSNTYTQCSNDSDCSSPVFGCECKWVLPCNGNIAKSGDELCPNPDWRQESVPITVRGNAVLSEADFL